MVANGRQQEQPSVKQNNQGNREKAYPSDRDLRELKDPNRHDGPANPQQNRGHDIAVLNDFPSGDWA